MAKKKQKATWNRDGKITSAIRKIWRTSPMKVLALEMACVDSSQPVRKRLYKCAICGGEFVAQLCDVDHKVEGKGEEWGVFIERIFLGISKVTYTPEGHPMVDGESLESYVTDHLDVLCIDCHKDKTTKAKKKGTKK